MTFPVGTTISTTNVDSPAGDPSLARADIYNLIVAVNSLIASYNKAQGVLVLDNNTQVPTAYLPNAIAVTGNIALQPTTGVISLQNVARLAQLFTADLGAVKGTTSPQAGDLIYLVDGDAGKPCLGVYDGGHWRIVRLMTQVGDVGAALTARFTLSATATP